jgi:hypothetical protein
MYLVIVKKKSEITPKEKIIPAMTIAINGKGPSKTWTDSKLAVMAI